jgi:hypothetical protein
MTQLQNNSNTGYLSGGSMPSGSAQLVAVCICVGDRGRGRHGSDRGYLRGSLAGPMGFREGERGRAHTNRGA